MPQIDPTLGTIDPYLPSEIKPALYYYDEYQSYDLIYNFGLHKTPLDNTSGDLITPSEINLFNLPDELRYMIRILNYDLLSPYCLIERYTPLNIPAILINNYAIKISQFRQIFNFFNIADKDSTFYTFPYTNFTNFIDLTITTDANFKYCNIFYLYNDSFNSYSWGKINLRKGINKIQITNITPFSLFIESANFDQNIIYNAISPLFHFNNIDTGLAMIKTSLISFYEKWDKFPIKKVTPLAPQPALYYIADPNAYPYILSSDTANYAAHYPSEANGFDWGTTTIQIDNIEAIEETIPEIFKKEIIIFANNNFWDQDLEPTNDSDFWTYDLDNINFLPFQKEDKTFLPFDNSNTYDISYYYHRHFLNLDFQSSGYGSLHGLLFFSIGSYNLRDNIIANNPITSLTNEEIINLADKKYY